MPLVHHDQPGTYAYETRAQAERRVLIQQQSLQAERKRFEGAATVRTLQPGTTFTLLEHPEHNGGLAQGDDDDGYAQEHWRNFKKLGMTVRIERKPKGKYIAVFKGKVAAKKIAGAAATQVAGVAAQKTKNAWQRAPLGSPGAAFLDGGFGRTGKAGFGGVKRIFLNSTSNFKSGMKIQVIGTVFDLWGDMTSVFGEDGSKDLTEFLGRAGVTLIKAGATAALGSLLAAGVFAATTVAAGIFGVATAPVWLVAGFVVGGYILAATLIEVIDGTVEGKERVAQWAR